MQTMYRPIRYTIIGIFSSLVLCSIMINAAHSDSDIDKLKIILSVEIEKKDKKKIPTFSVEIINNSLYPLRILDIRNRPDLQDFYFDIIIAYLDGNIDIVSPIADPAEITERDFILLGSGEAIILTAVPFLADVKNLPNGRYKAFVKYLANPMAEELKFHKSLEVNFSIR